MGHMGRSDSQFLCPIRPIGPIAERRAALISQAACDLPWVLKSQLIAHNSQPSEPRPVLVPDTPLAYGCGSETGRGFAVLSARPPTANSV